MDEQFGTLTTGIVVGEDHKERLDRAWREPEFQRKPPYDLMRFFDV